MLNSKKIYGFLFIVFVLPSLIFTRCKKEEVVKQVENTEFGQHSDAQKKTLGIGIPVNIGMLGKEAVLDYLKNLDKEGWDKAEKNYKVSAFLDKKGITERVTLEAKNAQQQADTDLTNYLTKEESAELEQFELQEDALNAQTSLCINDGVYYYFRFVATDYICYNNTTILHGTLYECVENTWVVYYADFYQPTTGACTTSSTCNSAFDFYSNDANYPDTGFGNNFQNGDLSIMAKQKISVFLANELSPEAKALQHLYIKHQDEINAVFESDDSKFNGLKEEMRSFLITTMPLINTSFLEDEEVLLSDEHLNSATRLFNEMAVVMDNPKLVRALQNMTTNLKQTKGKSLKTALRTYGK